MNTYLSPHWDYLLNSNEKYINRSGAELLGRLKKLFLTLERYTIWEQIVATIPILISVPLLIFYIYYNQSLTSLAELGVLLAVLPRTLQLLGNVHELSVSNSRAIFMSSKYKELMNFCLSEMDVEKNISNNKIQIVDRTTAQSISINELKDLVKNRRFFGRITITGENGSGKSSLIKTLKSCEPNSLIISPEVEFDFQKAKLSTGQRQIEKINLFLQEDFNLIFLDEWAANLDKNNIDILDNLIDEMAKSKMIIEVVHSKYMAPY